MKKLIIFFTLVMVSLGGYSQTEKKDFSKDHYLQKSKNQRTVGWILLGGGAAVGFAGLIVATDDLWDEPDGLGTGLTLFTVGAVSSLASIPFFLSARNNSQKAASLSMESQRYIIPGQELSGIQLALSLKLEF